jgi:ribonuclease HII
MVRFPHKTLERMLLAHGHDAIVGVDEVGMGCLAGPVVVCATLMSPPLYAVRRRNLERLRDSKLLSAAQRERYARELRREPHVRHVIVTIPPRDVDRLNVLQAARRGMQRAVARLLTSRATGPSNAIVLVDGNRPIPDLAWPQQTIVGGDRSVFAIAGASVLAKVHRDALMVRYATQYPGYGFEVHKGYGTAKHVRCLRDLGPSPLHRRSFSWGDGLTKG